MAGSMDQGSVPVVGAAGQDSYYAAVYFDDGRRFSAWLRESKRKRLPAERAYLPLHLYMNRRVWTRSLSLAISPPSRSGSAMSWVDAEGVLAVS